MMRTKGQSKNHESKCYCENNGLELEFPHCPERGEVGTVGLSFH